MLYSLAGSRAALLPRVTDRRSRYRRARRSADQPGDTKATQTTKAPPPEIEQVEARVRARDRGMRWERIMALSAQLSASLSDEARTTWLALEESLHGYWLDVSIEHYLRGFEAGAAQSWLQSNLTDGKHPREKLQAIAAALAQIIAELEKQPPQT
jgi:hypothetical protein